MEEEKKHRLVKHLDSAEKITSKFNGLDEVGRAIISTGVVNSLGMLSNYASCILGSQHEMRYINVVQKLIDFLEEEDFANLIKEAESISEIKEHVSSIRVPDRYKKYRK